MTKPTRRFVLILEPTDLSERIHDWPDDLALLFARGGEEAADAAAAVPVEEVDEALRTVAGDDVVSPYRPGFHYDRIPFDEEASALLAAHQAAPGALQTWRETQGERTDEWEDLEPLDVAQPAPPLEATGRSGGMPLDSVLVARNSFSRRRLVIARGLAERLGWTAGRKISLVEDPREAQAVLTPSEDGRALVAEKGALTLTLGAGQLRGCGTGVRLRARVTQEGLSVSIYIADAPDQLPTQEIALVAFGFAVFVSVSWLSLYLFSVL